MGVSPENPQDSSVSLTRVPRATTLPPRFQTPGPHGSRSPQGSRMQHGTRRGRIEVIAGVMFSGKSEELIRRVRRAVIAKKRVQVFKSHLDARYAGLYSISTHDGGIVRVANTLADQGVRIVLAGIDMDFRGLPFGPMPALLAIAEIVDKLQAICVVCGEPASRNQRLVNGRPALWDSPTIMVGGRESYEARCRHCHTVPRADEDQTALL